MIKWAKAVYLSLILSVSDNRAFSACRRLGMFSVSYFGWNRPQDVGTELSQNSFYDPSEADITDPRLVIDALPYRL